MCLIFFFFNYMIKDNIEGFLCSLATCRKQFLYVFGKMHAVAMLQMYDVCTSRVCYFL